MQGHESSSQYTAEMVGPTLRRAMEGKRGAADCLWSVLYTVVSHCAEVVGNRYGLDAIRIDDIVQTCLCRLMITLRNSPETLLAVINWQAWLYKSLKRLALDQLRVAKGASAKTESLDQTFENGESISLHDRISSDLESPETTVTRKQFRDRIEQCIASIPDPQRRQVFRLYYQGYSYQEIAATTGVAMNIITISIYRIKLSIINALSDDGYGG